MRWFRHLLIVVTRLGETIIRTIESAIELISFSSLCVWRTPRLLLPSNSQARKQLFNHLFNYGPCNLRAITVLSLLFGAILSIFAITQFQVFGLHDNASSVVAILVSRQVCPLMVAILLLVKSGVTNTAELRRADPQIKRQTIDNEIVPEILALTVVAPLLLVYAITICLWSSYFVGTYFFKLSAIMYIQKSIAAVDKIDLIAASIKVISYGALIGFISAYYGFRIAENKMELSSAIISTLTRSIFAILIANIIIEYSLVLFVT